MLQQLVFWYKSTNLSPAFDRLVNIYVVVKIKPNFFSNYSWQWYQGKVRDVFKTLPAKHHAKYITGYLVGGNRRQTNDSWKAFMLPKNHILTLLQHTNGSSLLRNSLTSVNIHVIIVVKIVWEKKKSTLNHLKNTYSHLVCTRLFMKNVK